MTMHDLATFGQGCLKIAPSLAALAPTAPFRGKKNKQKKQDGASDRRNWSVRQRDGEEEPSELAVV